jgi:hypothetical protein
MALEGKVYLQRLRRSALAFLLSTIVPTSPAFAQSIDVARWFGPEVGNRAVMGRYSLDIYADAGVEGQDTDLGLMEHNFFLVAPVWQNERNELGIITRVELQDTDTDAVLPRDGIPLPSQLWEVRIGGNYRGVVRRDWIWGVNASIGSASNEPFQAGDAFDGTLGGLLRIPHKERNAWLFFLYFATNREFLNYVPLPGAGYWWEPSDSFRAVIGVPFVSLAYNPIEKLSLDLSYFPVRNIRVEGKYRISWPLTLFAGFDWRNQRYFRADRDNNDERIFYYEKRIAGGLRVGVTKQIALTFEGGWAFDRFYFEGEEYGDRGQNMIDVDDSPYGAVKIGGRF